MPSEYGNYTFSHSNYKDILSYSFSAKDYFDVAVFSIRLIAWLAASIWMSLRVETLFSIELLVAGVLGFATIATGMQLISKILTPTSNRIEINHQTQELTYKEKRYRSIKIDFDDIRNLNYALIKTFVTAQTDQNVGQYHYHVVLNITLTSGAVQELLVFHPQNIFKTKGAQTEKELIQQAQPIVKELARLLNKTYTYHGIQTEK